MGGENGSASMVVLPSSQRPPAPAHVLWIDNSNCLPTRSPRWSRLVHDVAPRLLKLGLRAMPDAMVAAWVIQERDMYDDGREHTGKPHCTARYEVDAAGLK